MADVSKFEAQNSQNSGPASGDGISGKISGNSITDTGGGSSFGYLSPSVSRVWRERDKNSSIKIKE